MRSQVKRSSFSFDRPAKVSSKEWKMGGRRRRRPSMKRTLVSVFAFIGMLISNGVPNIVRDCSGSRQLFQFAFGN
jgi:hypothetical protein